MLNAKRFAPLPTVALGDCRQQRPTSRRCECGGCGKTFLATAIIDAMPAFDDRAGGYTILRHLHCDFCNHVEVWTEGVDLDGRPSGVPLGPRGRLTGTLVEKFLARYPEAAGVEMC